MGAIMWRGKQKWRNQLLFLGIIVMGLYILLIRGYHMGNKPHLDDIDDDLDMEDEDLMEEEALDELTKKKKVESVTFMPPAQDMHAWDGDAKNVNDKVTDQDVDRAMKYHRIWSYAHAVTTVHELWSDTPDVDTVLSALQRSRIVHVDTVDQDDLESGTAEKWVLLLEGGQKAMMKIVWEPDIKGAMKNKAYCNFGFEMPWAEIAAFHLHRLLGFRNIPYATGRIIDLKKEILPVATPAVARQLSVIGSKMCVTGTCFHCEKPVVYCPENGLVEASIVYWVPHKLHLWTHSPKYMPYSTPREDEWSKYGFNEKDYCNKIRSEPPYDSLRYYHDLFDFAVIDTLMHHYDSKHYIVEDTKSKANGLTVRLDHGRAFCSYDEDKINIFLAPLTQCCMLRRETYWHLKSLLNGRLSDRLRLAFAKDPITPILKDEWWEALERRLKIIVKTADKCIKAVGGFEKFVVG